MSRFSSKAALLLLLLMFLPVTAGAQEAFDITNYKVDVEVTSARMYNITETIDVFFNAPKHGIIRAIPTESSVEDYKIKKVSVTGDDYSKDTTSNYLELQIGDADTTIEGAHTYNIAYSLMHIQDDATGGDYAYIDLIGTEWDTGIANADISLTMPTDAIEDVTLTSGRYSSNENAVGAHYSISGNVINVTAQNLSNYEGITIMVKMPEGTFADAPTTFYLYADILSMVFSLLSIILLLVSLVRFFRYGKDKEVISVVEYYPPDNMNPAEIGYVIDRSADNIDITSLVIYWASRGYLKFEQGSGDSYTLYKVKDIDSNCSKYEIDAFNALWKCGKNGVTTNSNLTNKYYKYVSAAQKRIPELFKVNRTLDDPTSSSISFTTLVLVVLSAVLPVIAVSLYAGTLLTTGLTSCGVLAFMLAAIYFHVEKMVSAKYNSGFFAKLIKLVVLAIFFAICVFYIPLIANIENVFPTFILSFINFVAFVSAIVSALINKRSDYGHTLLERILGFKDFLETAEKDKLEMLLDETPSYFYDILPYAMVMNVTDKWADKFEDLITEPPEWYYSRRGGTFRTSTISRDINRSMMRMKNDMTSAPSSSGGSSGSFGGGGFSGGGSGGGGGRSW